MSNSFQALSNLIEINESRPVEMLAFMSYKTSNDDIVSINEPQDYDKLYFENPERCIGCLLGNYLQENNPKELKKLICLRSSYEKVAPELDLSKGERAWVFLKSVWSDQIALPPSRRIRPLRIRVVFDNKNFNDKEHALNRLRKLFWYKWFKAKGSSNATVNAYVMVHTRKVESK